MAKRKPDTSEYLGEWDDGTYQTGAIRPPKPSSGLIAFLLVLVIFLGGICSALGILNIRLLQQLSNANQETTPLEAGPQLPNDSQGSFLENVDAPEPAVPEGSTITLQIRQSPYYSEEGDHLTAQQIFQRSKESLVQVQCLTHFGATQTGVGLIVSSDGFILVNHHVVDAAMRIFVTLPDGNMLRAALVGSDSFSDLAVLYIQAQGLNAAVFSNNKALQVTDPSFATNTHDGVLCLKESAVFSIGRTFHTKSSALTLIQTCQGGEIGPVFDSFGHVIGFQAGQISQYFSEADTKGTGLVIPTDTIRQILQQLVKDGRINGRPCLGIEVEAISKAYQQFWQLPAGLLLTHVTEGSDADLCGLQEGDILLALDGNPAHSRSDLYTMLYNHQIGDTIIAVVSRDGQKFTVKLTIEENVTQ